MTFDGWFGEYGGRFVPETLVPALDELEAAWREATDDPSFADELDALGREYAGRPTPLTLAERFLPGTRVYLKREDLLHTGAHKLNNALGQAVLARRLGKPRIVAETGAGQHGVAAATVCARFGLECVVYMGEEDMRRQRPNVERMGLLGAEVRPVDFGTRTLKEATSEAIRDWITNVRTTHYLIGSCVGPHPYPEIVRELQAVIGREAREQFLAAEGRLPDAVVACVGGGSNAIGLFAGFVEDAGRAPRGRRGCGRGEPRLRPRRRPPRCAVVAARRRRRPDRGRALDLRRARLPRRRARSTPRCGTRAARTTSRPRTTRRWRRFADSPRRRGSSPRSSPRTRSRVSPISRRRPSSSASPGAATRIWTRFSHEREDARRLPHGRRGDAGARGGGRARRRRHHRDRLSLLGSARGRSRDPAGRREGAGSGNAHDGVPGVRRRDPQANRGADRADDVCLAARGVRLRALRRGRPRGRRRRASSSPTCPWTRTPSCGGSSSSRRRRPTSGCARRATGRTAGSTSSASPGRRGRVTSLSAEAEDLVERARTRDARSALSRLRHLHAGSGAEPQAGSRTASSSARVRSRRRRRARRPSSSTSRRCAKLWTPPSGGRTRR